MRTRLFLVVLLALAIPTPVHAKPQSVLETARSLWSDLTHCRLDGIKQAILTFEEAATLSTKIDSAARYDKFVNGWLQENTRELCAPARSKHDVRLVDVVLKDVVALQPDSKVKRALAIAFVTSTLSVDNKEPKGQDAWMFVDFNGAWRILVHK